MDFINGFAMGMIPPKDPEKEMEEVIRLLNITRAGFAVGAALAKEAMKKDPTIAEKARSGYMK